MPRLLHLARNIALSNFGELRYPYRLTCILTYRCQLKCNMCNIWAKPSAEELSLEQVKAFFANSAGFSWINLSGGEIFMRQDLEEIIEAIFRNCHRMYILDFPTNGFNTQRIVEVIRRALDFYKPPKLIVTISMDGPPKLHDKIRNTPGSWDRAVETFKELRSLQSKNFRVFLGMTLQAANLHKFQETFISVKEKVSRLRYSDFHVNIAQKSAHYYANNAFMEAPLGKEPYRELKIISGLRRANFWDPVYFLEKRYQRLAGAYLREGITPLPCQALSASFFMDPAGGVYPCSMYDRKIADISDYGYDIIKLWNTAARRELRKEIVEKKCPHCWTPCEAYQNILGALVPRRAS